MYTVAVDIGGTFTDVVVMDDASGRTYAGKSLTTPDDLQRGVFDGLADAAGEVGVQVGELLRRTGRMVHATTQSSNAVFAFTGARTAVLATRGFGDTLLIMRATGRVAGMSVFERHHYRMTQKPRLLVDERDIFEIPERMDYLGRVVQPLDEAATREVARTLRERGYEAVAVAFLFSHKNAAHERRVREILAEELPGAYVSLSAEVAPVMGEYERSATALFNAYVGPVIESYVTRLEGTLREQGLDQQLLMMQANGGVATTAQTVPIFTIESGPAAGVVGAAEIARTLGLPNVIATDVGGTTFKVAIVENGQWGYSRETVLNQYQLRLPMVDVASIGAGGGSIAWVDGRRLRIGPQSAAAAPGPACYGLGGEEPTVTDADLVLGYLDPGFFLGGDMRLDVDAARDAIRTHVAEPLGLSVEEAAWGIHRLVNEDMASAARVHAAERGHDATGLPLFAFGGAGPVHAFGVGAALGTRTVIVPAAAGVMSSVGVLAAPLATDAVRSRLEPVDDDTLRRVEPLFTELEAQNAEILSHSGVTDITHERSIDMRYVGQGFEVTVPVGAGEDLRSAFEAAYVRAHGRRGPDVPIEAISWRVLSRGPDPALRLLAAPAGDGDAMKGTRDAYFDGAYRETPIYDRYRMGVGTRIEGPAIVEERESTTVVGAGATARVAKDGSLLVETNA